VPDVVLLGIVVGAGLEDTVVDDRGAARDVVGSGGAAGGAEELGSSTLDAGKGQIGRFVFVQQLHLRAVRADGVGEGDEGGVFKGADGAAVGGEREVRLVASEEEELVIGDDGPADAKGEIIGVVGGDAGAGLGAVLATGGEALVGVVLTGEAVVGVGARFSAHPPVVAELRILREPELQQSGDPPNPPLPCG